MQPGQIAKQPRAYRRAFLKTLVKTLAALPALPLAWQRTVQANTDAPSAPWPADIFYERNMDAVLNRLFPNAKYSPASSVVVKAPRVQAQADLVPLVVDATKRRNIRTIAILADSNTYPLTAVHYVQTGALPYLATRIRMAKSGTITFALETEAGVELTYAPVEILA